VFEGTRQELAIFWIGGVRATTRLRRDRRRAIPKPKFALLGFGDELDNILARHKTTLSTALIERVIIVKINSAEFPSPVDIVIRVIVIITDNYYFTTSIDIRLIYLS
jgi:hypothetical protein